MFFQKQEKFAPFECKVTYIYMFNENIVLKMKDKYATVSRKFKSQKIGQTCVGVKKDSTLEEN